MAAAPIPERGWAAGLAVVPPPWKVVGRAGSWAAGWLEAAGGGKRLFRLPVSASSTEAGNALVLLFGASLPSVLGALPEWHVLSLSVWRASAGAEPPRFISKRVGMKPC